MHKAISSTLYWEGMEKAINTYVKKCTISQKYKKKQKKYGKLPPKNSTMIPWDTVPIIQHYVAGTLPTSEESYF